MPQPYLSIEAELHDAFWDAEDDESEVRLMADFLSQFPGKSLEIGSGSGRLMFPLLARGFDIEGLEISPDMVALGSHRAERLGVHPVVHQGDMETWTTDRKFAALLAPTFTLQLASNPQATLRHWHQWLEPNGGLYLTVFIPYAELSGNLPENTWYPDHRTTLADGRRATLETRHQLDRQHQRLLREHRYSISGKPPAFHQSRQTIHWFEHEQMLDLLQNAGFRTTRVMLDFDPAPVTSTPDPGDYDGILTYQAVSTA